eukprot:2946817-Pleurochrysis_carterae.AAC.2
MAAHYTMSTFIHEETRERHCSVFLVVRQIPTFPLFDVLLAILQGLFRHTSIIYLVKLKPMASNSTVVKYDGRASRARRAAPRRGNDEEAVGDAGSWMRQSVHSAYINWEQLNCLIAYYVQLTNYPRITVYYRISLSICYIPNSKG